MPVRQIWVFGDNLSESQEVLLPRLRCEVSGEGEGVERAVFLVEPDPVRRTLAWVELGDGGGHGALTSLAARRADSSRIAPCRERRHFPQVTSPGSAVT